MRREYNAVRASSKFDDPPDGATILDRPARCRADGDLEPARHRADGAQISSAAPGRHGHLAAMDRRPPYYRKPRFLSLMEKNLPQASKVPTKPPPASSP